MKIGKTEIRIVKADITKLTNVEAIVNSASKTLQSGGGVNGAIHKAAGDGLLQECRRLKGCSTGEAKITRAYRLPCVYVIHTVAPVWHGGSWNEAEQLTSCYRNCLRLAKEKGIRSIAFPSLSTGVNAYPADQAAEIAIREVMRVIKEDPDAFDLIQWALFDQRTKNTYDAALQIVSLLS
ncbi:MAG: macro domain-containing protein [Solobacterium sp.]|nr:macro domain-containing protein [Solobacterium sp.]